MTGRADNPNGELMPYITGADTDDGAGKNDAIFVVLPGELHPQRRPGVSIIIGGEAEKRFVNRATLSDSASS